MRKDTAPIPGTGTMQVRQLSVLLLVLLGGTVSAVAQQMPPSRPESFSWASLTDPACPVTSYAPPVPVTKEIRVLYFPTDTKAAIKEPKAPVLHLIFNDGTAEGYRRTVPFVRRDDGVWIATVALEDWMPNYAIYWIEDRETKQADTNGGKYFEVRFCDAHGQRSESSVQFEARSYTGILEPYGIERSANYAEAIQILKDYIRPPAQGENLISSLWTYELAFHEDTPDARAALLGEINQFVSDHSADGFGLVDALNFAAYRDWIPQGAMEKLVQAIEKTEPNDNPRLFVLNARAAREKDRAKRIELRRELVDKYPDSDDAGIVRQQLMFEVTDLSERERLYEQIRARDPDSPFEPLIMATMYLDADQKLPKALVLLDEAEKLFDANARNNRARIYVPESTLASERLHIALMRADILVRLGKPAEALSILQSQESKFTLGSSYYILGRAFEGTGDKRAAIDAYLQAVVRPSKDQKQANAALESLWRQEKLGSKRKLQQRIDAATAQSFGNANYRPHVLDHRAPDFDLTTLHGKQLESSQLRGKKMILNFWAVWCGPCLSELGPLQEFQQKHPEIEVLTIVGTDADAKQLKAVIRENRLITLQIAEAPQELWERFGVYGAGLPQTLVIDENGFVRIQHVGALPNVSRYLTADLNAMDEARPVKQPDRGTDRE